MSQSVILDLYCCAGGIARGFQRAGFKVVGVDHRPQPRYAGDEFVFADVLSLAPEDLRKYVMVHASPPCQWACALTRASGTQDRHRNLIPQTRELLEAAGVPYVIENVPEARSALRDPVLICGAGVGLRVVRHRLFEANWPLRGTGCCHKRGGTTTGAYVAFRPRGRVAPGRKVPPLRGRGLWRQAVEIDWMTEAETSQAIPPAYGEFIGRQFAEYLAPAVAA